MPRPRKIAKNIVFIPIAQAEDILLAQDCERLLRDNEIEVQINEDNKNKFTIDVDDRRFNEAYVIIQNHITPDGFFDIYSETMGIKDPNQAA